MNKQLLFKLFLTFLLFSVQVTSAQTYTPLVVTSGFNEDVIAENSPAATFTTAAVDATSTGANNAFMTRDYPGATVGLPVTGLISSVATVTPGLTFQLAPFNGSNALRINENGGTGTFVLQTHTSKLSKLFILATSGSSVSTFTGTITFTDGTTQAISSQSVPDWYQTGTPPVAIQGIGRVPRSGGNPDNNASNPKMFQVTIAIAAVNQTKFIQQVAITKTSATSGFLNIFALSGEVTPNCIQPEALGVDNITPATADLSWEGLGDTFDVKWGVRDFNLETAGTLVPNFENGGTLSGLTADTNYEFYVRQNCGTLLGVSRWSGPFRFFTGYCIPTGSANNADEIRNFTLSNLNNSSTASDGVAGYKNYSSTVAPAVLEIGTPYRASLTSGSGSGTHGATIWIDYNSNMIFDANERVASINNTITSDATVNFPAFTVPATVQPGIYRLRVQYQHNRNGSELNPCGAFSIYAEIEDYAVEIRSLETCFFPSNIQVTAVTKNAAKLTWRVPTQGDTPTLGYKIEVRTSGVPGDATGLVSTSTTTELEKILLALTPSTAYSIYIQSLCSATDSSTWTTLTFTTLCNYPEAELATPTEVLSRCGTGSIDLEVTTQGVVHWYTSATSNTPIYTGNTYTTGVLTQSTSFWYAVATPASAPILTGPLTPSVVGSSQDTWTTASEVYFTIIQPTTLQSMDIFPLTTAQTGRMTFKQRGGGGSTVGIVNYTTSVSGGTTAQTVAVNLEFQPGTYVIETSLPTGGLKINASGATYPYSSTVASITGNAQSSIFYMGYYNWNFTTACKAPREEVAVTLVPSVAITNAEVDVMMGAIATLTIESTATSFAIEYGEAGFERGDGIAVSDITSPYNFSNLQGDVSYDVYIQALPCGSWYGPVTFTTISAAQEQTISVSDVEKVYGENAFVWGSSDSGLALSYAIEDESIAVFREGNLVIKGVGQTSITASQAGNGRYLPAQEVTFDLTVTAAELTVTAASNQDKEYGASDPTLTYAITGFKYSDTSSSITGALTRETGENVGTYPILLGTLRGNTNYRIRFVSATFAITAAELHVSVDAQTKSYGDSDPTLTYQVTGLKNNEAASDVFSGTLSRLAGENVGLYAIGLGTLEVVNNYTLTFNAGELAITAAELSIVPTVNQQKIYGQVNPIYSFTATGFKFEDTIASAIQGTLGRLNGENVGLYSYIQGSIQAVSNNYTFRIVGEEKFKITPAALQVVVNENQQKLYGQADPVFTYSVEGLQRGDLPFQVFTGNLTRLPGEVLGLYPIGQGSLVPRANYTLATFSGADFKIISGTIQGLTLPSKSYIYDGNPKALVVEGTPSTDVTITYTNNNQTDVGRYAVTARIESGSNYEPLILTAVLTITKADQSIAFEAPYQVILEDTPTLQLTATASSSLPVSYTINEEQTVATVTASGLVRFLTPGVVTLTANQAGNANYNAATPVSRKIEVISKDASILNLIIDGVSYGKVEKEVQVIIGCDTAQDKVILEVETVLGAEVTPSNYIEVLVPEYGQYEQIIKVKSMYGTEETYRILIEKRIPTDQIVYQKYDNVLLVNNNKQTNGGYVFSAYQWFKNGEVVGNQQAYSAGDDKANTLEVGATYHVALTLHNGKKIMSCPIYIEASSQESLSVYPNPVRKNQLLYVSLDQKEQEITSYVIYNLKGQTIKRGELQPGNSSIEIPTTVSSGSYFLVLKGSGKQQSVQFIVKE
ncbi:MBG domain-containing protein [Myroides odoratus]|uniref:MBG domain-containing protein n=1 Tax=Myroides odoratus TaxID=256 RepID=UPI0039AEA1D2